MRKANKIVTMRGQTLSIPKIVRALQQMLIKATCLRNDRKWFRKKLNKAKRHERIGDKKGMRDALLAADNFAQSMRSNPLSFRRNWEKVLSYQLAVFDIPGAELTAQLARSMKLPDKSALLAGLPEVLSQLAEWRGPLEDARKDLLGISSPSENENSLVIFVPSVAMGIDTAQQPGLRCGLRFIFGEIVAACREADIPFEFRGRIANHGTPHIAKHRRYISHHTISQEEGGLHIKATDMPSCFSFDTRGYSGWSAFSQTPLEDLKLLEPDASQVEAFFLQLKKRVIGGNISKYVQSAAVEDVRLPGNYVFLGLQVIDDSVQALARISMLDMLEEVANICREKKLSLVVKRHPRCGSRKVARALAKGVKAGWFQLSEQSIHSLVASSCAVCVVNSSVGAEALLHEKPVYVFGEAEYQHVCYPMREKGDFARYLQPNQLPVSQDILMRFIYVLRNRYAVNVTETESARKLIRDHVRRHAHRDAPLA